jgi:hypothetical protein
MEHTHEHGGHGHGQTMREGEHGSHVVADRRSLNRTALSAAVDCLTGCAIGEVLGMVVGTGLTLGNWMTVVLSVVLAFVFGYSLAMVPLVRSGLAFKMAAALAFASDTGLYCTHGTRGQPHHGIHPRAMDAGLTTVLFWGSLVASLVIAGVVAFPLNQWLIVRGKGHAVLHAHHH